MPHISYAVAETSWLSSSHLPGHMAVMGHGNNLCLTWQGSSVTGIDSWVYDPLWCNRKMSLLLSYHKRSTNICAVMMSESCLAQQWCRGLIETMFFSNYFVFRQEILQRAALITVVTSGGRFETPRISTRPPQIFKLCQSLIDNCSTWLHTNFSCQWIRSSTNPLSANIPRINLACACICAKCKAELTDCTKTMCSLNDHKDSSASKSTELQAKGYEFACPVLLTRVFLQYEPFVSL